MDVCLKYPTLSQHHVGESGLDKGPAKWRPGSIDSYQIAATELINVINNYYTVNSHHATCFMVRTHRHPA